MIRRIALVNFTGIRPNWGCQATSWEWLQFINSALGTDPLPHVALVPLLPRHAADQALISDLDAIYEAIEDVAGPTDSRQSQLDFLERLCRERYGEYAELVVSSDAVFFQAEGSMTGTDVVRGIRLILLPFVAKHAWGKPVFAFNHTIFSCDDRFGRAAAAAFNSFDLNAVREPISLSAARNMGMQHVYHIPDCAFLTRPVPDDRLPSTDHGSFFAVTGSALPRNGVHEEIFRIAEKIRAATRLTPLLAASTKADLELVRLAEERWAPGDYAIIPSDVSYAAAAQALRSCAFLVGGRYHLSIIAATVGTTAIQLRGNTYKNEGLSALIGGLSPVHDFTEADAIVGEAMAIAQDPQAARERVAEAVHPVAEALVAAREWLSARLAGRDSPVPQSMIDPPGSPIDHRAHIEPYCELAATQAASFRYPPEPASAFGQPPAPRNILPALAASCLARDPGAIALLRQLAASYPAVAAELSRAGPPLRSVLS